MAERQSRCSIRDRVLFENPDIFVMQKKTVCEMVLCSRHTIGTQTAIFFFFSIHPLCHRSIARGAAEKSMICLGIPTLYQSIVCKHVLVSQLWLLEDSEE